MTVEADASQWTVTTYLAATSIVLSLASLIWNAGNSIYTARLQTRLRSAAAKLGEFANVRSPINSALQAVDEQKKLIVSLRKSARSDDEVRAELAPLNGSLVEAFSLLEDALEAANESRFATGADWLEAFQPHQHEALNAINRAFNPTNPRSVFDQSLDTFGEAVRQMGSAIRARIETEISNSVR